MSWFARIEERTAAFIERAFASMFPSDLEPAQIARKLVATMEARSQQGESGLRAPGTYEVVINPADFTRLREHRQYLESEWNALLADVAQRVGIRFESEPVTVTLHSAERVAAGAIEIRTGKAGPLSQAPLRFVLRLVNAPREGAFSVDGAARVGRGGDAEIALHDLSVSRNHALLDVRSGQLVVRDAGSTNGTFVNGLPVQEAVLKPGDVVAFGKTEMRVESAA